MDGGDLLRGEEFVYSKEEHFSRIYTFSPPPPPSRGLENYWGINYYGNDDARAYLCTFVSARAGGEKNTRGNHLRLVSRKIDESLLTPSPQRRIDRDQWTRRCTNAIVQQLRGEGGGGDCGGQEKCVLLENDPSRRRIYELFKVGHDFHVSGVAKTNSDGNFHVNVTNGNIYSLAVYPRER